MKNPDNIGVVVLAAGGSTRLGRPKQLVEFHGKPLLQLVIDEVALLESCSNILVLGGNREEIQNKIDAKGFKVVVNSNWEKGIATSMHEGFECLLSSTNNIDHILFVLSDQPFLKVGFLKRLVNKHLSGNLMATYSEYEGILGVPAIFSQSAFPFLKSLKGDQGAKKLTMIKGFEFDTEPFEKGIFDVDSEKDVEALKKMEL